MFAYGNDHRGVANESSTSVFVRSILMSNNFTFVILHETITGMKLVQNKIDRTNIENVLVFHISLQFPLPYMHLTNIGKDEGLITRLNVWDRLR